MKRNPDESFENYKERRKLGNITTKIKLSGILIHDTGKFTVGVDEKGETILTKRKGKSYVKK